MVDTIAELASLSKTLNKKSDNLNATIRSINKKLEALNFGMNVTLKARGSSIQPPMIEYDGTDYWLTYGKYRSVPENEDEPISYGPDQDEWQLGIYIDRNGIEVALLRAPREVRIRALDLIPDLLEVMKAKAEDLIGSIDRAEKLAENL